MDLLGVPAYPWITKVASQGTHNGASKVSKMTGLDIKSDTLPRATSQQLPAERGLAAEAKP